LLEAAFDEELTSRIKEIANLSDEIVTLKTTLEETINNSKGKVQRTDSSIEFELLHASTKQNLFVGGLVSGEDTVQHDLMTEIQNYDDKLKEKDQTIDKLKQGININLHLVHELQNMNEMFNNLKKEQIDVVDSDNLSVKERIRHESFDVPNLNESLEPETMSEFVQIQEIQKLKENIGSLIKENMKPVKKRNFDNLETSLNFEKDMLGKAKDNGNKLTVSKSQLQIQEERTKQAFLENEAAEKETERKLRYSWTEGDCESVENLTEKVKRELELSDHLDQTLLSVSGTGSSGVDECVDDLSQQIVDKLLVRICKDGNNPGNESKTGRSRLQAFLPINDIRQMNPSIEEPIIKRNDSNNTSTNEDHLKKKNIEMKQLEERHKFQLQQEKCHVTELQAAIMQERQQSLNVMEKLNSEKESKTELEEEIFSLREEIGDLQTQLMRHRDEIEELSSLYEAEKLQTCVLEEALQEEKENFKRITSSLDEERQRSREVSMRDSDTIIDLRTALEVKKENESRLGLDSPLFGKKSNNGSKLSLYGSRQSIPGHKSPIFAPGGGKPDNEDKIIDELLEERSRCDRLKECLEIEREKSGRLAETTEAEVQELLEQVRQRDEQVVQAGRRLEVTELEKSQLLRELENYKEKLNIQISENKDLVDKQNKMKTPENGKVCSDAFYIEDLESKLEAYREREEDLQHQIDALKKSRTPAASSVFPIMKSSSFGGSLKNIPQEPQDQAIFFFRKLLRAESYRKALVWQKRYLSLLLSSYQESEILSLGRLARMSGARKMLVADIPRPQGKNVQFRVVVHTIISISRMKFLVKRWKKTKKNVKKAWSQDSGNGKQDSEMSVVHPNRQPTEELEPGVSFIRK